jgi:hypothetical protein
MAGKLSRGKKGLGGAAALAVAAGRRSAAADIKVEEDNVRRENAARLLSVQMIKERPSEDTRPVNDEHVLALMESIKLVGLIQPIYLDRNFHLVAGAHRLTAFKRLHQEDSQRWSKIPVVVDPDLDATLQPEQALIKEIAENEKRSNLTPEQVQAAAQRLIATDSSFTRRPGRLKKGERALTPFLANTFGVSTRYVRALLNEDLTKSEELHSEGGQGTSRSKKTEESTPERDRLKLRKSISRQVNKWLNHSLLREDKQLLSQLEKVLKLSKD